MRKADVGRMDFGGETKSEIDPNNLMVRMWWYRCSWYRGLLYGDDH
jgi:hypothetical protein